MLADGCGSPKRLREVLEAARIGGATIEFQGRQVSVGFPSDNQSLCQKLIVDEFWKPAPLRDRSIGPLPCSFPALPRLEPT